MKVIFFAALREQLATEQVELSAEQCQHLTTIAELTNYLVEQEPSWQAPLLDKQILCAVNQNMASSSAQAINFGDEIAFFPPVTGG